MESNKPALSWASGPVSVGISSTHDEEADLDLIVDHLYLGSFDTALNPAVHEIYEIKYILNVTESECK